MGFRFWSLRAEASHLADAPEHRVTFRDALLLHRLNGIRAQIARVVYWLWLALTVLVVASITVTAFNDPRTLPANLVVLVAWVGWAVGLRYWARSHSDRAASTRGAAA